MSQLSKRQKYKIQMLHCFYSRNKVRWWNVSLKNDGPQGRRAEAGGDTLARLILRWDNFSNIECEIFLVRAIKFRQHHLGNY